MLQIKQNFKKMKKILKEQVIDKETKKQWLSKAIELGCFDNFDYLQISNETPVEKNGDMVILAKGLESKKDWLIKYNPTEEKNPQGWFWILQPRLVVVYNSISKFFQVLRQ